MSDRHISKSNRENFGYRSIGLLTLGLLLMPLLAFVVPVDAATMPKLDDTQFQLQVYPSTPKLPADRNSYYAMVQLQVAETDDPIAAPTDMEITLISSDPSVLTIPATKVVLHSGESMVKVPIITTDKAGVASITAQTERVKSATATITTYRMDSLEPTRLAIYSAPNSFIPDPNHSGLIYIQVLNSQNLPTVSKNDISLDISSSDATIGRVPSYAVIPAGSSGIMVSFTPQKNIGSTTIKASTAGLAPGELITMVNGPTAAGLKVEFAPDVIPAVNYYDALMTVQLVDVNDEPVVASTMTKVLLKSSDTAIIQTPQYVEIPAGQSYALTSIESRGRVGTATVTASATGFATGISSIDAVPLSTAGQNDEKQLQLFSLPSILAPDNSEHQALVVAFKDSNGSPYRQTGYLYQRIALSTSNIQVGEITSTAFGTKETYAIAKFKTKYAIGDTEITAALEGYQPAQMTLTIAGSGPASVALSQIPGIIQANNFDSESLVISLLDHDGNAVAAREDTIVYLSSSDPEITTVPPSVTIPKGQTYVTALAHATLRSGSTTISGSSDGLGADSISFKTVGFTGSISEYHLGLYTIPNLPADNREYEGAVVQLQDQAGLPVLAKSDVKISLSSGSLNAGTIQDSVVIQKGTGQTSAVFKTSTVADDDFKITASSQGYTSIEADMSTTTQPLVMFKTSELPTNAAFGDVLPIGVDVYSGAIPMQGVTVTIGGPSAEVMQIVTDENGHAEGTYISKVPGSNNVVITASKPGYDTYELTTRTNFQQTVDISIKAQTQGSADVAALMKVIPPKGVKIPTIKTAGPVNMESVGWGLYTLEAPLEVKSSGAVLTFKQWSDGIADNHRTWNVIEDSSITAIYSAKYLLQVNDVNGQARGAGYYEEGTMATISVGSTSMPGILVDKDFGGWAGSTNSESATTSIAMDGPKTVNAIWKDNYLKVALIAIAIGAGGFFYYWKIFTPKRKLAAKEKAPDLDWYKS